MRRVISDLMMSLDGCFEGPKGEIDWFVWDKDMEKYSLDVLQTVDAILLGRVAYQLFASYWPTPAAAAENPAIASLMNRLPKIAFSRTLDKVEWNNSRLVRDNIPEEMAGLKNQPGKDLVMFGGAGIFSAFARLGLIDEYRFRINPLVLGNGRPLFKDMKNRLDLKFLKSETSGSGVVTLFYQPARPR